MSLTITTVLEARGPAAAVLLSDEQVAEIGGGAKTPPVKVTVNGHTFDGRIGRMRGENLVGFNKAIRAACGVEAGDEVEVTIALDDGPREVALPAELAAAFKDDPAAAELYEGLAFTHRKEFAVWVADAKREETKAERVAQTLEMLHEKRTRS